MHDCQIYDCLQGCLYILDGGSADVEDCSLVGSKAGPGVHIEGQVQMSQTDFDCRRIHTAECVATHIQPPASASCLISSLRRYHQGSGANLSACLISGNSGPGVEVLNQALGSIQVRAVQICTEAQYAMTVRCINAVRFIIVV